MASSVGLRLVFLFSLCFFFACCDAAATSDRLVLREAFHIPWRTRYNKYIAQQVHISMVGLDKVRVTWITGAPTIPVVYYGLSPGVTNMRTTGSIDKYSFGIYRSGSIHNVVIGPLDPNTVYYYKCGANSDRELSFKTPPARLPINFAVVGDLGQSVMTKTNLDHISKWDHDMLILPGDLAYANGYQPSWDSFGRLVEPLASKRPWMVTQGNHEVEKILKPFVKPFKAYNYRWMMPYQASGSKSNLYYSFDTAGGAVHVVMLGSYTDYGPGSDQYIWLKKDLMKVDRRKTPWVFAVIHAPWYNTNVKHQGEAEMMRVAMESLLYKARVDVVFAGHVHAYERFDRVYQNRVDQCGPVHITIGCGGNKEGLATKYQNPRRRISLFREASFGHGRLQVVNNTHAYWSWQRNHDDFSVVADGVWLTSLSSKEGCFSPSRSKHK